jgi:ACS family D-galactonate transporter-like MFS transporter
MARPLPAADPGKRISIAILLGVGVLVNYFDRVNLSVAHDALQKTFGISDVVFGYLLGSYSWTYAAMQLPCGTLLDRFGVRRVMLVSILLWALASGLATIAPTIILLFAARYLLGIGEAPTFPANAKAIGLWFPERERGRPTATFDAAAKLSIGVGTPILGLILLRFGLRANFATTAVLSLLYAGLFGWVYRDPAPGEAVVSEAYEEAAARTVDLLQLLGQRKILGAAIGAGACNYSFYLLLTWLPYYLERGLKMTPQSAVLWSAVPWLVGAASGFCIGGVMVDRLLRSGHNANRVRMAVLVGGTALGLFIFAPVFVTDARIALVCLTLALAGISSASPVAWTLPSLLGPHGAFGRVGSIINLAGQIAAITAPIFTGYLRARTHSFASAFALAGIVQLIGIAGYALLLRSIRRVELPSAVAA